MHFTHFFFLSTFFSHISATSQQFCKPILSGNQLTSTGLLDLANYTTLNGIITLRSENVIRAGLLEFLIESGHEDKNREDLGVALIRVEFKSDRITLSSRYGRELFGMQSLMLMNETQNSSQILQFLGSDELAGRNMIKIFGSALQQNVVNFPVSLEFLQTRNWTADVEIKKIYKTIELSVLDFCPTSYPRIVCESDKSKSLNSDESLVSEEDDCIEKLVMSPGQERTLTCIGYGAPDMNSSWRPRSTGGNFKLVRTKPDSVMSYEGNYALETRITLTIDRNSEAVTNKVICEIWNKNFDFPHRNREKTFLISVEPEEGKSASPADKKQISLVVYTISITAGSVFLALVLLLMIILLCRRRMKSHNTRHQRSSAPEIPQPPVPEKIKKMKTSSSHEGSEEVEHIYETIDETLDPASYCYAWTVSSDILEKTRKPVKMFLCPSDMPERRSRGHKQYSLTEQDSSLSQSFLEPDSQRTYSNTGLSQRQRQINRPPRANTHVTGPNSESEYVTQSVPIRPRGDRQSTKSEYVPLSVAKTSLDVPEYVLKRGDTVVRRDTMRPIMKTTVDMMDFPSKHLV